MIKISCAIVVKDNPLHLKKTLDSVDFSDEIVIFDIGIDEKLKKNLKKNKKIKIIPLKKEVLYVEQIREEEKRYLKNDWVLYIDPDEIFPKETLEIIEKEKNNFDCFSFPRKNFIFGQWIKHSRFYPDYQTRLFKKDALFWPKELHSQPKIEGKEYLFEVKEEYAFIHYNYENLDQWFEKFIRYGKSEALYHHQKSKKISFSQTIKKSLTEFISRYFLAYGYKDGIYGFILAFLQMFYYFIVYFYYLEKKNFPEEEINPEIFFQQGLKESLHWKKNKTLKEKIIQKII